MVDSGQMKTPKAAATAKGANIACVGANAKLGAYPAIASGSKMAIVHAWGPDGLFVVRGQAAKALIALVNARSHGVTALEVNSWAYRLAAYVHQLRQDYGLTIDMDKEPHGRPGQWHGRYRLVSPVIISGQNWL